MEAIDIIIMLMAAALVVGVVAWSLIRKKQGKSCACSECKRVDVCSGNCANCSSCSYKPSENAENER